jgi:hypothetical protein
MVKDDSTTETPNKNAINEMVTAEDVTKAKDDDNAEEKINKN